MVVEHVGRFRTCRDPHDRKQGRQHKLANIGQAMLTRQVVPLGIVPVMMSQHGAPFKRPPLSERWPSND